MPDDTNTINKKREIKLIGKTYKPINKSFKMINKLKMLMILTIINKWLTKRCKELELIYLVLM